MRAIAIILIFLLTFSKAEAQAQSPACTPNIFSLVTQQQKVLTANLRIFNDDTSSWTASTQGGSYSNIWIADFGMMIEWAGAATLIPPSQVYNTYRKFILAASSGNMPIAIKATTASAQYSYSGLDTVMYHTGGDPIWYVPILALYYYNATLDTTTLASDLAVMDAALASVPRNGTTHLVDAGSGSTLWITWGFQDGVQKSGDDLMGSLLLYRAEISIAALYGAVGNSAKQASYTADAALIAANIGALWDAADGMFYAASGQNKQIDVNGSAMAVVLGLTSSIQTSAVTSYLVNNIATLANTTGYIRQSPTNWAFAWDNSTYDNNYWSWGNYWVYTAISTVSPSTAKTLVNDFVTGPGPPTNEYFISNTASGAAQMIEAAAGVIGFVRANPGIFPEGCIQ